MPSKAHTKPPPPTTADYISTLEKSIRELAYGHHTFTVFRHFVEVAALAFSNAADPLQKPMREAQYMAIVPHYKPEEFKRFPDLLALLVAALEQEPTDVLGVLYQRLEIQNERTGQFVRRNS